MKRVSSVNSLLNYSFSTSTSFSPNGTGKSITNVYGRVLQLIELYRLDPFPEVARMANLIFNDIHSKAFTLKDANSMSSFSELDSPNHRQSYISNESPLMTSGNSSEYTKSTSRTSTPVREAPKHHSGRVSVSAISSPYLPHSSNYNSFMTQYTMKRTIFGRDPASEDFVKHREHKNGISESKNYEIHRSTNSFSELQACRKPLVHTSFVDWCTKHFCQPCSHSGICGCTNIELSQASLVSEWRSSLLKKYYHKAKRELENNSARYGNEMVLQKKNVEAHLVALHPFEKFVVYANAHNFSVWNYGSKVDSEPTAKFSNETPSAKITDLQLINTHENALLMVASDNGSIKVWRDLLPTTFPDISPDGNTFRVSPQLSTAFFMFEDIPFRCSDRSNHLVLCWDQQSQRILAGGDHKFVRLWDANKEMKVRDILIDTDSVTSLSTDYDHLICAGCEDGAVRLMDDRQKSCQVFAFNDRNGAIVNAKIWPVTYSESINIVSGNRSGQVCWYDKRLPNKALRMETTGQPMTAMNFHENTDVFAW